METKITVKLHSENKIESILLQNKESVLDALLREGIFLSSVCGGSGRCGKCMVRVLSGNAPISTRDKELLKEAELADGYRLACTLYPTEELTIAWNAEGKTGYEIISEYKESLIGKKQLVDDEVRYEKRDGEDSNNAKVCGYHIVVDLGTTTLSFVLVQKESKEVIHTVSMLNSQRMYGADVLSRIQASVNGKKKELQECIQKDLQSGIKALLDECNIKNRQIEKIVIAGNTTMIHLLKGYDCSRLGVYPFAPQNIKVINESASNTLGFKGTDSDTDNSNELVANAKTTVFPGISAFIGGDIVSGLYALDFVKKEEISLLIDLGTNGEIALGNKDRILVTSVAAGSAFEGGNISCGTGSVAGAICAVDMECRETEDCYTNQTESNKDIYDIRIKTIKKESPCGICGSGIMETVAELLRNGIIDETGLLSDVYFESGFALVAPENNEQTKEELISGITQKEGLISPIILTQKDIREFQMAKAAVRAGIELLMQRYGIAAKQIDRVYLAGGFGFSLNVSKAVLIGLLPKELSTKVEIIGNSSLAGCIQYLTDINGLEHINRITKNSQELILANDEEFNARYVREMSFENAIS